MTRCPAVYLCCFFQSSRSLIDLKLLHNAASNSLVAFLRFCFFLSVKFLKDKCCHNHFLNKRWEDVICGWPRRIETSGFVEELLHFYPCSFLYVLVRERCVDVINVSEDDKLMLVRPCVCNYCLLYQTVWVTCILQRKWVYNIAKKLKKNLWVKKLNILVWGLSYLFSSIIEMGIIIWVNVFNFRVKCVFQI